MKFDRFTMEEIDDNEAPPVGVSGTEDDEGVEPTGGVGSSDATDDNEAQPVVVSGTEDDGGVEPTRESDAPVKEPTWVEEGLSPIVFIFSDKNECRLRLIAQPIKKCQYQVCYSAGS